MIRVNLSEYEHREFSDVPRGRYNVKSEEVRVFQTSENSKHPKADMWSIELRIQDEEQENQPIFDNVLIPCNVCAEHPEGQAEGHEDKDFPLYTLFAILENTIGQHKWTEEDIQSGDIDVEPEDLEGLYLRVRYGKQKNSDYMEVKGYMPWRDEDEATLSPE